MHVTSSNILNMWAPVVGAADSTNYLDGEVVGCGK